MAVRAAPIPAEALALFFGEVSEWSKVTDSKSVRRKPRGFESLPLPQFLILMPADPFLGRSGWFRTSPGEVTEWPKVHDWKSCVSKGTEGSNPSLSAILPSTRRHLQQLTHDYGPG